MTPPTFFELKHAVVAIAGLGGLGSNVAVALARLHVGKLILADFDCVDVSNLNRQHYFIDQVGMHKVDALTVNLRRINNEIELEGHKVRLTPNRIVELFKNAHVIAECFDRADQKQMITETVLTQMERVPVVTVSGLAGYGRSNAIQTHRLSKRLVMIGDLESGIGPGVPLTAPRVGIAAFHQANAVAELLIDEMGEQLARSYTNGNTTLY